MGQGKNMKTTFQSHIKKVKPAAGRIKTSSTGLACIPSGNPPDGVN